MNASALPTSSGADSMKSRQKRMTSPAIGAGHASRPPSTIGPTGWSCRWNEVTTPKLPPPPRSPQNSSGFSSADAVTTRPSAVTTSAAEQVVAREAELALEPAAPAPEREPGDAGARAPAHR